MSKDDKNNSGDRNSGNWNSGNWNSGSWNSGNRNSGDWNSGNWNSGNWNSGSWNSGMFNTDEPNMRIFNKQTDIKYSDFINSDNYPSFSGFSFCVWIREEIMTDKEKKEFPTHKTTRGYLKELEYKEAWSVFWRNTPQENKKKFLNLPNFNPEIFKEITGIDVNNDNEMIEFIAEDGEKLKLSRKSIEEIKKLKL